MPATLICQHCGVSFLCPPSHVAKRRYCSAACRDVNRPDRQQPCVACGKTFYAPPSRLLKDARFCSRTCANRAKVKPLEVRFWSKVNRDGPTPTHRPELGPCWVWTGHRADHGYGRLGGSKYAYAHRLSYEFAHGPIVGSQHVMHECDNPACVRPDHLRLGDQRANNADRQAKGRGHRGEQTGSAKLTERQVRAIRTAHAAGAISMAALGRAYGVSGYTIRDIVLRITWQHVP